MSAAVIPRAALRQDDQVWLVDRDGRLRFTEVEAARREGDDVLITGGLDDGDRVVVGFLKGAADGMKVRTVSVGGRVQAPPAEDDPS
jgi:hypothetical protein